MPQPVFMLCCDSIIVDKVTSRPSFINVFNTLQKRPLRERESSSRQFRFVISAEWLCAPNEIGKKVYEFEFRAHGPSQQAEPKSLLTGTFQFDVEFQRLDLAVETGPVPYESGILKFESRIREQPHGTWLSQYYPLLVEMVSPESEQDVDLG